MVFIKTNQDITEQLMRLCYSCDNVRNCETIENCEDCFNEQMAMLNEEADLREYFRLYAL